jgi:archaellum component FlaC
MFKDIKDIFLALSVILTIVTSLLFFSFRTTAKGVRLAAEDELLKAKISKDQTIEKLSRETEDRDGIKGNLDRLKKEAASLEAELSKRRSKVDSIKNEINEIEEETAKASKSIEQTVLNIEEIRRRVANVVKDTLSLREELILLQKTKSALEGQLAQYSSRKKPESSIKSIESQPVFEPEPQPPTETTPPQAEDVLRGEVLTVNREFDFIVVSLGKNEGVAEGMVFDVFRDDDILGQVEIETVRTNISAASLINKEAISLMRAGDKIRPAFSNKGKSA